MKRPDVRKYLFDIGQSCELIVQFSLPKLLAEVQELLESADG